MATIKKRLEALETESQFDADKLLPIIVDDNVSDEGLEVIAAQAGRKVYRFSDAVELFI